MNQIRRVIVGAAVAGSLLTGGVIGATIAGPLGASAASTASTASTTSIAATTAATPGSGTFVPRLSTLYGLICEGGFNKLVRFESSDRVGLSTIAGRLLGSVPANVSRRAKVDVLIVHTTP